MSFIYLIVEAGGQQTEQGFKEWVGGWRQPHQCLQLYQKQLWKWGSCLGCSLLGGPYFWAWRDDSGVETKHFSELFERQSWRDQSRNLALLKSLLLRKCAF